MASDTRVQTLHVPGARIHYEVRGSGPTLLMICGGPTDADVFAGVAGALADRYRVVTYDPHGNSRSQLNSPAENQSIAVHADDAHWLLAVAGDEPADVFGNSSGAMVALDLVTRYPEQVRTVVAHEPPAIELLPDRDHQRAFVDDVYDTYLSEGTGPAMMKFMAGSGLQNSPPPPPADATPTPSEPSPEMLESMARTMRNLELFLGHNLRSIAAYVPDTRRLRTAGPRIVVAVGQDSSPGQVGYRAGIALAERLGITPVHFPSDHGGFMRSPSAFAAALHTVLQSG